LLLIEVDGMGKDSVDWEAEKCLEIIKENNGKAKVAQTAQERDSIWTARRAALPALAQVKPATILEDATVPRTKIVEMLAAISNISKKYNIMIGTFSKFSHEFQALCDAGEDTIFLCNNCGLTINREIKDEYPQCPECGCADFTQRKGIEVGNIFQLGTKYSDAFDFTVADSCGKKFPF